jgi:hypothetical protein
VTRSNDQKSRLVRQLKENGRHHDCGGMCETCQVKAGWPLARDARKLQPEGDDRQPEPQGYACVSKRAIDLKSAKDFGYTVLMKGTPTSFAVGDTVRILFGGRWTCAEVIEDRGNVGWRGRHLVRVRVSLGDGVDPMDIEMPADETRRLPK